MTERVDALCCECGAARTVHRNYWGPLAARDALNDGEGPLPGRASRVLKCASCGKATGHAVVTPDDERSRSGAMPRPARETGVDIALRLALLWGLGVTVAWAPTMEYAALWLTDYCVMVLARDRGPEELDEAIEDLMPSVRESVVPEAVPADW